MAVYKVAQDVEADDKLLGPFSFRQFLYLIVVAIALAAAWGLYQVFPPLVVVPLPLVLFFGALALPLKKDQPMEIYLAALASYYLKPRKRLWVPDGVEQLVEITAPKVVEIVRTKSLSQTEAEKRLSYLADIADTGGWSVRHVSTPQTISPMISDVYFEAQQAPDVLDTTGTVAQSFETMINQADVKRKQTVVEHMHQPSTLSAENHPYPPLPSQTPQAAIPTKADIDALAFNPYPNNIHQTVIQPISVQREQAQKQQEADRARKQAEALERLQNPERFVEPAPEPPAVNDTPTETADINAVSTSENQLPPDIINLANNPDLSIETIQREADRIRKKHEDEGEVFIPLR